MKSNVAKGLVAYNNGPCGNPNCKCENCNCGTNCTCSSCK